MRPTGDRPGWGRTTVAGRTPGHPHTGRRLIAGLGNPGPDYRDTRHNVGFRVADRLAGTFGLSWRPSPFDAEWASGFCDGIPVILAKPMTFMNRSGGPLGAIAARYEIPPGDVLVVHDDIDLAFGTIKIKAKGGHGGHNGLRSIIDALADDAFARLRVGIGRPEAGLPVTDHVLGPFDAQEREALESVLERAREAAIVIVREGTTVGMNRYNRKRM